jgi:hypothetical protein
VGGPGLVNAKEAFNSYPVNIDVTITGWNDEAFRDVVFDG